MCCKVILITVVVMMVVFHQGFGLSCFDCYSEDSWEQCEKGSKRTDCTERFGSRNVSCLKSIRYKVNRNRQEGWTYMKRCFETEKCNKEFCLLNVDSAEQSENNIAFGCNVDCCRDKDFCNAGNKEDLSLYIFTLTSMSLAFY